MKRYLLVITITLMLSCGSAQKHTAGDSGYENAYAGGFSIERVGEHSSLLTVFNPWQGAKDVTMQLFVSREGELPPVGFGGTVVSAPLKSVVCMSSSYVAFIDALDETSTIKGVSGAQYIFNEKILSGVSRGLIRDVGSDSALDYEAITVMRPDLVLVYGVSGESAAMSDKMRELGVQVAYIGEYLESHPLGKAEWIVFFGELFDRRDLAETIFNGIAERYEEAAELVKDAPSRPKALINSPYRDTWYMPSNDSYMVKLITDAGGATAYDNPSPQTVPVAAESAYVAAQEAAFWLNPGTATSVWQLIAENPRFKDTPPVRSGNIYNNNCRSTPGGGSDFWESGVLHQDIILRDLIRILHPEAETDHELYYYQQLE